jgi:hypothetical protein
VKRHNSVLAKGNSQSVREDKDSSLPKLRRRHCTAVKALRLDARLAARTYSHTAVVYSTPAVATAAGCVQPSYWCNCRAAAAAVASTVTR